MAEERDDNSVGASRDPEKKELSPDQITSAFQPIVDLASGLVIGYEALGRLKGREHEGFRAIVDHIPYHAWGPMLDAALQSALSRGAERPAGTHLFVNVSVRQGWQLTKEDVKTALIQGPVVIELPERVERMVDWAQLRTHLKNLNLELAMDDFGAGVGDFERLMAIHPHWLKLDYGITAQLSDEAWGRRLVKALQTAMEEGGVKVIAEGIEKITTLGWLREIGTRYGQGFLLARPQISEHGWSQAIPMDSLEED